MSGKGDCYDNAVAESFFKTLKVELVYQQPGGRYATRAEERRSVFEYVEVFYNRRRLHSGLGYVSPEQFEAGLELTGDRCGEKAAPLRGGGVVASPPRKTPDAAEKDGGLLLCGGNKTSAR